MAEEKVKQFRGGPGQARMARAAGMRVKDPGKLLKRLLGYVFRYYTVHLIVVVLCIFGTVYSNVQGTLFLRTLIDQYIEPMMKQTDPDFAPLAGAVLRVASFYAMGIACTFIQARTMINVSQGTMKRLRTELFETMERLPIRYFDNNTRGNIMSVYTNDIDTIRQMISQSLPQMLSSVITVVSIFSMMIVLSVRLTLVTIGMVALMMFLSSMATRISGKNFAAQQRKLGQLNGFIEETMTGAKVVKVFCHEEACKETFDTYNEELFQSAYRATAFANVIGPISTQLGNASYVLCAMVGGLLALDPAIGFTVGGLASFLTFNRNFTMPINQVTMQFASVIMALAGAERIFNMMDEVPEQDDGYVTLVNVKEENGRLAETEEHTGRWAWKHTHQATGDVDYVPLRGDVVFEDVDFGYTDEKEVLHGIDLHALPGEKVALVGSTGAGKTTITNLINRFYDIQKGKIRYDDINVNKIRKGDLRRSLGMVLQDTHLFTGTVRDNIRYGRLDASDADVEAAARLANADSFIRRLPQGYDTVLTGDGANLSQGQRQLLAIARAAIADPPVLILDEATSSIDTRTEKIVQSGMDRLMHGRTSFVIAHRLSTVRNSDCILVMEQGRIIERGTHEQLLEKQGRYYQLYTGGAVAQ
ncbi:MAG: ABC transporter ATP-binding protein/permease [Lachnospiraceae bacterium]|nr:ABC transporter ATP-binding protein/permease [Lachnospiraceae bacterium]